MSFIEDNVPLLAKWLQRLEVALGIGKASPEIQVSTLQTVNDALANSDTLSSLTPLAPDFVNAAITSCPDDISVTDWAIVLAAICWRETKGGQANGCLPKGYNCVGDTGARWKYVVPAYATELNLWTGNTRQGSKGVQYEIRPPAYAGAQFAGWGYGIMQVDFVSHRDWLDSNDWASPSINIAGGAGILRDAYDSTKLDNLTQAVAAYNAGVAAVASAEDPDDVTTGGNYASDVMSNALAIGLSPSLASTA